MQRKHDLLTYLEVIKEVDCKGSSAMCVSIECSLLISAVKFA
jgi:hypothetical protein